MNTLCRIMPTADAFRHFIIRTLTDDIPPDGDEKEIARFDFSATRHLTAAGCSFWLQKFKRSCTHDSITVTVSVDNYLMDGYCRVRSPELPDMPCDFFIRRQQFIYPCAPTKSGEE